MVDIDIEKKMSDPRPPFQIIVEDFVKVPPEFLDKHKETIQEALQYKSSDVNSNVDIFNMDLWLHIARTVNLLGSIASTTRKDSTYEAKGEKIFRAVRKLLGKSVITEITDIGTLLSVSTLTYMLDHGDKWGEQFKTNSAVVRQYLQDTNYMVGPQMAAALRVSEKVLD